MDRNNNSRSSSRLGRVRDRVARKLSTLLIVAGVVVIALPFITEAYGYFTSTQLIDAWNRQAATQKRAAEKVRADQQRLISAGELPEEDAVLSAAAGLGGTAKTKDGGGQEEPSKPFPKTKIIIPKIQVNQVIMEGVGSQILQYGPGHYPTTANPGDRGNVGIAGHRVTYTHPFNRLDELAKGDRIVLETVDYIYEYEVETMEVTDPKDISNLKPSSDAKVTLTTCNPKYSARTRLNVMGVLVNSEPRRTSIIRTVRALFKEKKVEKPKPGLRTHEELLRDYKKERHALRDNPADAVAYITFSRTCFELGKYDEAFEAMKKARILAPDAIEVQELQKSFDAKERQLKASVAQHDDEAVRAASVSPSPYFELGALYMATGRYKEALAICDKAVGRFPYASDTHVSRAEVFEKLGNDREALEEYDEALVFDPTNKTALDAIERIKNKKPDEPATSAIDNLHYRLRPQ